MEVTVADNGVQAVERARLLCFDLILMDLNMPMMGGLAATRKLRSFGYRGKIYAMTANNDEHTIQGCELAGCNGYLAKPIDKDKFTAVINEIKNSYR